MEADERPAPVHIRHLCAMAAVQEADAFAQLIQQPRGLKRRQHGAAA
jgi:hypothetical protein